MLESLFEYHPKINIILMTWIFILVAVMIDLVAGVWKAKTLGYLITSDGLKRTVNKMVYYYMLMFFASMMDIAACSAEWLTIPYISILFCLFILFIEAKSVFERANEKERKRLLNAAKEVTAIIASDENFVKTIHESIKKKEDENK